MDERNLTLNLKGGRDFHTCKLFASLVTGDGGGITEPWIERRESKVKLSRKDNGHLCSWVTLIVTVFVLTYVFWIEFIFLNYSCFKLQLSMVSNFKSLSYFLFWKVHSYPLLIFLLVCFFFPSICRNSVFIRVISPSIYGLWMFFPIRCSICLCVLLIQYHKQIYTRSFLR